jgi:hypothetical protein
MRNHLFHKIMVPVFSVHAKARYHRVEPGPIGGFDPVHTLPPVFSTCFCNNNHTHRYYSHSQYHSIDTSRETSLKDIPGKNIKA